MLLVFAKAAQKCNLPEFLVRNVNKQFEVFLMLSKTALKL